MTPNLLHTAVITGLMFLGGGDVHATTPAAMVQPTAANRQDEYRLKARYVSLLPDHVTWPAACGPITRQLTIGVVGESSFGNHLNDLFVPGKPQSRRGRLIYIARNLRVIETCDVLFICESESERLYEILRMIKGRPILTIADSPDFARRGVMINLVTDRDRINLEVNLPAARLSELQVSPQVLKNAKIIE